LMFSATSCHIQGDDFHVPPRLTPNKSALNSVGKDLNYCHLAWLCENLCKPDTTSHFL